jgi:hypothetical protein
MIQFNVYILKPEVIYGESNITCHISFSHATDVDRSCTVPFKK